MIKAYESTIDEAVESQLRVLELTGQLQKEKRTALSYGVAIVGLVLYLIVPFSPLERLSISLPFAFLFAVAFLLRYKHTKRKQIRKWLIQYFGSEKPIPSEYEFNIEGIFFRRLGTTIAFAWPIIQDIRRRRLDYCYGKARWRSPNSKANI